MEKQNVTQLPLVRRFEAAGFRAWPAASVQYDGSWVVRLTAGHPARRLNSINVLDPSDTRKLKDRIEKAARRFDSYERPLTFRVTPLTSSAICAYLDAEGWKAVSESIVMVADINSLPLDGAIDHIPLKDIGRFVEALITVRRIDRGLKPGLSEIIGSIVPDAGLFVAELSGEPLATAICVHDNDLAGLFEVATCARLQRRGHGRDIVLTALKWAKLLGARSAWLQVEADNEAALGLYRSLGFAELYRYHYRQLPD
jgi:ribosomal protein S18 acetylase RimI-like enzyme